MDQHGFQHGHPQAVDLAVGAQAHKNGGKERQRIEVAGEDGAEPIAGEVGRDIFRFALHGRLDEQSPDRGTLLPRQRLQAHALCMREKALGDRREIVLDVEAHRKPRSVWRKRENEKANALGKGRSEVLAWTPLAHRLEDCADFPGFDRFIDTSRQAAQQRRLPPLSRRRRNRPPKRQSKRRRSGFAGRCLFPEND